MQRPLSSDRKDPSPKTRNGVRGVVDRSQRRRARCGRVTPKTCRSGQGSKALYTAECGPMDPTVSELIAAGKVFG